MESDLEREMRGKLPYGWIFAELGEITEPSTQKVDPRDIEETIYIGLEHIERETGKLLDHGTSREVRSTKSLFHSGDVLYAKLRPYLNKVCVVDLDGVCSTDILVFPNSQNVSNKFLAYRMLANDFVAYASQNMSGVQHPRVHFKTLAKFPLALPPLPEQKRIVDKIEELLTQLEAGMAELDRVQANLARYKASVLKAACEGRLVPTEAELARTEGRDYESGEELLERILAERKQKWEEEQRAKGKDPNSLKYKTPEPLDTEGLPVLPEGWVWVHFDQLLFELKNGYFSGRPAKEPPGIPLLRISAVRPMSVSFDDPRFLTEVEDSIKARYKLERGDLLFTRYNGNPELVGACGMVREVNQLILYPDKLIRAIIPKSLVLPEFLEIYFASEVARKFIERKIKSTAGQNGIAGSDLKITPVALPPLREQRRIVSEVDRKLSIVQELRSSVESDLKRAERLRQAILKQAFEGKLVSQDATVGPARELLKKLTLCEQENESPPV